MDFSLPWSQPFTAAERGAAICWEMLEFTDLTWQSNLAMNLLNGSMDFRLVMHVFKQDSLAGKKVSMDIMMLHSVSDGIWLVVDPYPVYT